MKCQDLMNPNIRTVASTASVLNAARLMRAQSLGFLVVEEPVAGGVVGVITDRDLATRVCAEDLPASETAVATVATAEVLACREDEDIKDAEERMRINQKSRLVVVDRDNLPVGILSLTDILHGDRGWRALKTARGVLSRQANVPHQPIEGIHLTPSEPGDEEAALRQETIRGGQWQISTKEFPEPTPR